MATWDAFDGKNILLKNWLDAFRVNHAITDPFTQWEPIDGDYAILRKILFCHDEVYSNPELTDNTWRPMDTENDVVRKILATFRYVPDLYLPPGFVWDSSFEWRPLDSTRDILAKILRVTCQLNGETNPQNNVQQMDNEIWLLRKIITQQ